MEAKEEKFEQLIKNYLRQTKSLVNLSPWSDCPSELELSDYLENRLSQERQDKILGHIAACSHCLSLLELAQRASKTTESNRVTAEMIRQAKNIAQRRPKRTILNYKWQVFALIAFILSFIFTQYFLQFLILAVIFSLKWIFDTGSTRTLIMIYEAWRKKDRATAQRIIQDFQDKVEKRK